MNIFKRNEHVAAYESKREEIFRQVKIYRTFETKVAEIVVGVLSIATCLIGIRGYILGEYDLLDLVMLCALGIALPVGGMWKSYHPQSDDSFLDIVNRQQVIYLSRMGRCCSIGMGVFLLICSAMYMLSEEVFRCLLIIGVAAVILPTIFYSVKIYRVRKYVEKQVSYLDRQDKKISFFSLLLAFVVGYVLHHFTSLYSTWVYFITAAVVLVFCLVAYAIVMWKVSKEK